MSKDERGATTDVALVSRKGAIKEYRATMTAILASLASVSPSDTASVKSLLDKGDAAMQCIRKQF